MAGEDNVKTIGGEEALEIARQGRDVWNEWAEENPGTNVDFRGRDLFGDITFSGLLFPGVVDFSGAKFGRAFFINATFSGAALFHDATFNDSANFQNATFSGSALFNGATFENSAEFVRAAFSGIAYFYNTTFTGDALFANIGFAGMTNFGSSTFSKSADFTGASFLGPMDMSYAEFREVPDFRRTQFAHHVSLHGVDITGNNAFVKSGFFKKALEPDLADKFRRLKEFAIDAKDHQMEQDFFALELRAKRFHEGGNFTLPLSFLYQGFSKFGQSVFRPFMFLMLTWAIFGLYYGPYLKGPSLENVGAGLKYSAAVIIPFFGVSRSVYTDMRLELFGKKVGFWIDVAGFAEGFLGIVFLFLIGLALRNRFRI